MPSDSRSAPCAYGLRDGSNSVSLASAPFLVAVVTACSTQSVLMCRVGGVRADCPIRRCPQVGALRSVG